MRRPGIVDLATVAVVLVLVFSGVSTPRAVAQSGPTSSDASPPLVVANGITARSIAVSTENARRTLLVAPVERPNRVLALTNDARPTVFAGNGDAGSLGDGGMASNAQLDLETDSLVQRSGIGIAPDGSVFIADTRNSTIRRIASPDSSEPGVIRSVAGRWASQQTPAMVEPLGLATDRAGNLFIADHGGDAVLELHADTGQLEILAQVVKPSTIAVTRDGGTVFVASADSGHIFGFDTKMRSLRTIASSIENSQGKGIPAGMAVDGGGNLFISAANLGGIYRLGNKPGAAAPTIALAGLHSPGDIAFDSEGNLYVSDQGSHRVLEFVGAGVAAGVTLAPGTFDFGDEPKGGATPTQQFTLANNSGASITGLSIGFEGGNATDFQSNGSSCLATLANNTSCNINVAFIPSDVGLRSSSLTVTSSAPTQQSSVSGTGDDYELNLTPSQIQSLTVVAGNSVTFNLQATNDAVFTGTVTFECPGNVPAATLCTFSPPTVTFNAPLQTIPFMITFQTTSRTKVPGTEVPPVSNFPDRPSGPLPFPFLIGLCFLLALYGVIRGFRAPRPAAVFALSILAIAAVIVGCHHKGLTINGTPAGTTNMIVQGTSQNATRGVPIQLVVQ